MSVTRDGRIYVGETLTRPDDLRKRFEEAILKCDSNRRARGSTGFVSAIANTRVSNLALVLRADQAARWETVHDVMRRAGASGLYRIHFSAVKPYGWHWGRFWLPAPLPVPGWSRTSYVPVGVVVASGGEVRYRVGNATLEDSRAFEQVIRAIRRSLETRENLQVGARIHAEANTSFEHVVQILDVLLGSDLERVEFASVDGSHGGSMRAVAVPREQD